MIVPCTLAPYPFLSLTLEQMTGVTKDTSTVALITISCNCLLLPALWAPWGAVPASYSSVYSSAWCERECFTVWGLTCCQHLNKNKTAISKRNGYYRREYVKEYNTVINRTTLNLFIQQVFISNYCMLSTSPNIGDTAVNKMDKIPCSHEVCILMREMNSK